MPKICTCKDQGTWDLAQWREWLLACTFVGLVGCASVTRLPAPPQLYDAAVPVGFPASVRVLSLDEQRVNRYSPDIVHGIQLAAGKGPVNILVLSAGGSGGAFGAGTLVGWTRAGNRPTFQLVTGVSAGALIAPFAYLGPSWDQQLTAAFAGDGTQSLQRSPAMSLIGNLISPLGGESHGRLAHVIDRFVTDDMLQAIAHESAKGRRLIVATTDLDKQETVLWDMGAIATQGGPRARTLFQKVLVASASVPGVFPPVLIRVHDGDRSYDEMHVDGGVTTPLFAAPLITQLLPSDDLALRGANMYVLINTKLQVRPTTTPPKTFDVLARSLDAGLTYRTRSALAMTIDFARARAMSLHVASIPVQFKYDSFVDFAPSTMHRLFDYALRCATNGQVWNTPSSSVRLNALRADSAESDAEQCPTGDHPAIH